MEKKEFKEFVVLGINKCLNRGGAKFVLRENAAGTIWVLEAYISFENDVRYNGKNTEPTWYETNHTSHYWLTPLLKDPKEDECFVNLEKVVKKPLLLKMELDSPNVGKYYQVSNIKAYYENEHDEVDFMDVANNAVRSIKYNHNLFKSLASPVIVKLSEGGEEDEVALDNYDMVTFISENWDALNMGEKGMRRGEAETYLGHSVKGMSREEIDEEVSEIQRAYYEYGEANEEETISIYLCMLRLSTDA